MVISKLASSPKEGKELANQICLRYGINHLIYGCIVIKPWNKTSIDMYDFHS